MKKLYFSIIVFLSCTFLNARVVTTIMNGTALNPFTWDCTCIPVAGDTIVINHALTLDVDYAVTAGGVQINSGGSITGNSATRIFGVSGGFFLNNGTMNIAWLYHNGGTFTNNTSITVTRSMGVDLAVTANNFGSIAITDTLLVNTLATFVNTGSVNAPEIGIAGTFNNSGTIGCNNYWNSGTLTHSAGMLQAQMNLVNSGNITLNAPTTIILDIWNAENITANYYVSARNLFNGDSVQLTAFFTNNATVSLSNALLNSEDINGSGDFCVGDSTVNAGNVSGTLDICDLNGGTWDLNVGTVAGTVTYCSGSCTIGMDEVAATEISLMPNPAQDFVTVQVPSSGQFLITVTDAAGRIVHEETSSSAKTVLNTSGYAGGVYFIRVSGNGTATQGKLIKQ